MRVGLLKSLIRYPYRLPKCVIMAASTANIFGMKQDESSDLYLQIYTQEQDNWTQEVITTYSHPLQQGRYTTLPIFCQGYVYIDTLLGYFLTYILFNLFACKLVIWII